MENPIKMDDLGVALFLETPTWAESMTKGEARLTGCIWMIRFQIHNNTCIDQSFQEKSIFNNL